MSLTCHELNAFVVCRHRKMWRTVCSNNSSAFVCISLVRSSSTAAAHCAQTAVSKPLCQRRMQANMILTAAAAVRCLNVCACHALNDFVCVHRKM